LVIFVKLATVAHDLKCECGMWYFVSKQQNSSEHSELVELQ